VERFVGILFLALVLATPRASAQPRTALDVTWEAPATCPSRAALLRMVAASRVQSDHERALAVHAIARYEGARWRATVQTRSEDNEGLRTLEARSCQRLTLGVALVIALALEEAVETPASVVPSMPVVGVRPVEVIVVGDDEVPPVLRRRRRVAPPPTSPRWHWGLRARVALDGWMLPSPTALFAAAVFVRRGGGSRALGGGVSGLGALSGTRPETGVTAGLAFVDAVACGHLGTRWTLALCAGAEAGLMGARSFGYVEPASAEVPYGAALARVALGVAHARGVEFSAVFDALAIVPHLRFEVAGVGPLHEATYTARIGVAASHSFW
jgi:hypothetical protein